MNLYFYVFIGVNVLSLLLCLYILIKFLRIYKIKDYPFSLPILEYYMHKKDINYNNLSNKYKFLIIILAYLFVFLFVRLSYKYPFLLVFSVVVFYFGVLTCFYGLIFDFFIFMIKVGRYIRDFYNYLKTGNIYGKCYYTYNKEYKWVKCFYSNELKNVNLFTVGYGLFLLSLGFLALLIICEGFVFEFSDEVKGLIFKRFFAVMLILAFSSCLIAIIKESIFLLKKKLFKLNYEYIKEVSFYPSGNVKELRFYKNGHCYMEKIFFDKKNRLYSYIIFDFDIQKLYFYSGNVAFEFLKKNNSIVYYLDNPKREIRAEAFFNENKILIYFVEYNSVKDLFNNFYNNIKYEIFYKDNRYIGWKYLSLMNNNYLKQDISKEEIDEILRKFYLRNNRK